jgi:hypothetical protein
MAIFHCSVKIISRNAGRSAVAAAAYRAGEKLHDKRSGAYYDYTKKTGVVYKEIILPKYAPISYMKRYDLWNAVEQFEKRKDAQTAREVELALPVEFERQTQIAILRKYINENFVSKGMCADFSIHDKAAGNPHAHIMLTTREVSKARFGKKNRDWNAKPLLESWRKSWADICNKKLQEKGVSPIDHRTLSEQGIHREPTIHLGSVACAMEQRGLKSERATINSEIIKRNESLNPQAVAKYLHELRKCYILLDKEISIIKQNTITQNAEIRKLSHYAEQLNEDFNTMQALKLGIAQLQVERQNMGFFQNKNEIDIQIQRQESSLQQAEHYFSLTHQILPQDVQIKMQRLTDETENLRQLPTIDLNPLLSQCELIKQEYRIQRLATELCPDRRAVFMHLEQLKKSAEPLGLREKMYFRKVDFMLNNLTKEPKVQPLMQEMSK